MIIYQSPPSYESIETVSWGVALASDRRAWWNCMGRRNSRHPSSLHCTPRDYCQWNPMYNQSYISIHFVSINIPNHTDVI